jgi:hypothetical protein
LIFTPYGRKKLFLEEFGMTTKKKLIIAGVAVAVVWVTLGSVFTVGAHASDRGFGNYTGLPGNARVVVKDYEPLELVFATVTAKKSDNVDIRDLLLKEAKKLGGHGIINVNVDSQGKFFSSEETLTGSALAIKYTDAAADTVAVSTQGWSDFRWGR